MIALIWRVASADAHRLSGHPKSLAGKLALAKRQVTHDRVPGSHHWLGRDRVYVNQLQQLIAPAFPGWWLRAALCVHAGEGSWGAATGNGFYGGMQFDAQTWLANGGGRFARFAHLATPHQQLLVAYWTWLRRGWYPWPTTARRCGLI